MSHSKDLYSLYLADGLSPAAAAAEVEAAESWDEIEAEIARFPDRCPKGGAHDFARYGSKGVVEQCVNCFAIRDVA